MQKNVYGKKNLKGKNRDFDTFLETSNFVFFKIAGSRDYQSASIDTQMKADDLLNISVRVKSRRKIIFNPF